MVGKDSRVEHIRIADDDPPCIPGAQAETFRGIPVVGGNFNWDTLRGTVSPAAHQPVQFGLLILGQGLGGKKVKAAGLFVFQQSLETGKVITEAFPGGGGSYHHHVLSLPALLPNLSLVGIYLFYTLPAQGRGDPPVKIPGKRNISPLCGFQKTFHNDMGGKFGTPKDPLQGFGLSHELRLSQNNRGSRDTGMGFEHER
jgi:hypothetical protein